MWLIHSLLYSQPLAVLQTRADGQAGHTKVACAAPTGAKSRREGQSQVQGGPAACCKLEQHPEPLCRPQEEAPGFPAV